MRRPGRRRPPAGFTLIELLVSMTLFIVVLTMSIGALMVIVNANAKAQNTQESVSNIQFALDSMSREIRTGTSYYCATSAPSSPRGGYTDVADCSKGSFLSIIEGGKSLTGSSEYANRRIEYRYNASDRSIERRIRNSSWVRMTNPTISINAMYFNVSGTAPKSSGSNASQPNVTIFISGTVSGVGETSSTFMLQTTVTQRVLDI